MAGRGGARVILACLICSVVILLAPILLVPLPPVVDLPNHFARLWLIAGGAGLPPLDTIYVVEWSRARVNVGIDLAAALFGTVQTAHTLARILLGVALILPVIGAVLLGRAIAGRWHVGLLLLPVLSWNFSFVIGFLNQQIAIGLALLAAAVDPRLSRGALAAAARMGIVVAIAVVHPFGAACYLGLIGAWCLSRETSARTMAHAALRQAGPSTVALLVFTLTLSGMPGHDSSGIIAGQPRYLSLTHKLAAVVAPFGTYAPIPEGVIGAGLLLALLGARMAGWVKADRGFLTASAVLAGLAFLGPDNLGDTGSIGLRLSVLSVTLLLVAIIPKEMPGIIWCRVACVALTALVAARTAWIAQVWLSTQEDARAVLSVVREIPAGSRLLVASDLPPAPSVGLSRGRAILLHVTFDHYPLLAIPEARIFVPYLFSGAGKQPVRVLPPYDRLASVDGGPVQLSALQQADCDAGAMTGWRSNFDFLLVMAPWGASPTPVALEPVAQDGFARLYRIGARSCPAG